ncbi:BTB/POZ domain-containing protein [Ditylenchus destructor]|nr:BTB/POZ domain-containing protein [Ditylenchus destructor]
MEEGTVEVKIDRYSKFVRDKNPTQQRFRSPPTYIYGLPWKIMYYSSIGSADSDKTLGLYLQCNREDDDPNWSCRASIQLRIASQKADVDDKARLFVKDFTSKKNEWGYSDFTSCDELLDPENGFIKDDVVILRAHVKAEMPQSAQMTKLHAFGSSISDPTDGTLIVGTNRIPIHKMYLSYYSDYFKAMFRSKFIEGRTDEVELEEVGYVDMLQLLSVIYPSNAQITCKNIVLILKLADRFIMPAVLEQCKNMLRTLSLNGAQKLLLAQQYNFRDLLKELAQQCKTVADAKKLKSEPEYKLLDSDTHSLILDSITS